MPKKQITKEVSVKVCSHCGKEFIPRMCRVKYCSPACYEAQHKIRDREQKQQIKAGTRIKGSKPGPNNSIAYIETIKCPRCEKIYSEQSDTKPPKMMRRAYCTLCRNLSDIYVDLMPYRTYGGQTPRRGVS